MTSLEPDAAPRAAADAEVLEAFRRRMRRLLGDAPCSGEGMFRKSEEALRAWSEHAVRACASRQADLLDAAADLLAPGGRLAYATCTFAPEENEGAVAALLRRRPELRPVRVDLPGLAPGRPADAGARDVLPAEACGRVWPHRVPGVGHFVALLERRPRARVDPAAPVRASARRRKARRADPAAAGAATLASWRRFASTTFLPGALPEAERPDALVESGGLL